MATSHDPDYYAYATRYYLQYLSAPDRGGRDQDPYHFFHYYRYYQERYAGAGERRQGEAPGWFATMPFRTERTQAFARFVQKASPSVEGGGAPR